MERRLGIIRMAKELIEQQTEDMAKVFSKLGAVVLRIEGDLYFSNTLNYLLYSKLFAVIKENEVVPTYSITITNHYTENGEKTDFDIKLDGSTLGVSYEH